MKVTAMGVSEEVGKLWFNSWLDCLRGSQAEEAFLDVHFTLEPEHGGR